MTDLLDLAARCEAATGADKHLDKAIKDAVIGDGWVPKYTASLDAAMTLVPKGWGCGVSTISSADILRASHHTAQAFVAGPTKADGLPSSDYAHAEAASPALALCAAALKALAAAALKARHTQAGDK